MTARVILGDCLEVMPTLAPQSVDMILADLPYGTTSCAWDSVIPFAPLWAEYERLIKPGGAIVLTASQPFTSALVMSNPNLFRYEVIWDKVNRVTGFLDAKKKPLKRHESILVFYQSRPVYNPQMTEGEPYTATYTNGKGAKQYIRGGLTGGTSVNEGTRYPVSILAIKSDLKTEMGLHPTQKPVALFEYLIRTYTNPGGVVLDNTAGSGTTGVAAIQCGRVPILIERDPAYHAIAERRVRHAQPALLGAS